MQKSQRKITRRRGVLATVAVVGITTLINPVITASAATTGNPYARGFYIQPNNIADQAEVKARAEGRTIDAGKADYISRRLNSIWLTNPNNSQVSGEVARYAGAAKKANRIGTMVLYNLPQRDLCGVHSAGGSPSYAAYDSWTTAVANGLRASQGASFVTVIIEPDALSETCNKPNLNTLMAERQKVIGRTIDKLNAAGVGGVYVDAGNSGWTPPAVMADRLRKAGVDRARGWSSNVSNFKTTANEITYNNKIRSLLGNKGHYIIDTSRNGAVTPPAGGDWCNPRSAGLGQIASVKTGGGPLDATLWVKTAGTSDGNGSNCGGTTVRAGFWHTGYTNTLYANRAR